MHFRVKSSPHIEAAGTGRELVGGDLPGEVSIWSLFTVFHGQEGLLTKSSRSGLETARVKPKSLKELGSTVLME